MDHTPTEIELHEKELCPQDMSSAHLTVADLQVQPRRTNTDPTVTFSKDPRSFLLGMKDPMSLTR